MMKAERNCPDCRNKCQTFKILTDGELDLLNKNKYEVKYRPKEVIFKQGSAISYIVSFNQGLAKAYIETPGSKDLILNIVKPTVLISGPGLYGDGRHHFSLSALTDCMACFIKVDAFKQVIRSNPDFAEQLISAISYRAHGGYDRFVSIAQKQIHGRVAETLMHLSENIFDNKRFNLTLSRQEFADFVVTSKESICRVLKEFKDEGIIEMRGNTIEIKKEEALRLIIATG